MLSKRFCLVRAFSLFAIAMIVLSACNTAGKPTVVIISPASGSEFKDGDTVSIQSASVDSTGISRVELVVDNVVVRTDTSPTPQGQPSLAVTQTWKATQGNHVIVVRAYNTAGAMSDPVAVAVSIVSSTGQVAPTVTSIVPPPLTLPTTVATPAPQPSVTNVPGTAGCVNDSAFVTDVTVPDGTKYAPGQSFNKIWRLSNSGSCPWVAGYQLAFVSGAAMTASTAVNVPPTAPGATADISAPMTAPSTGGSITGVWRMRNAAGTFFGKNVTVVINVVTSSSSSSSSSSTGACSGTPTITSFTASTSTISAASSITVALGTTVALNWGLVSNADSASIDHGIDGVETPGTKTVNPTTTTTWTLTATCGSNTKTAQVKVTVLTLPPPVMVVYDFVANASAAAWKNNDGTLLTFPGVGNESTGFVRYVNSPSSIMEDGSTPSRCLETHPKWVTGGKITGTYLSLPPSYIVQSSDHFYATVGFLNGAKTSANDANVAFQVWYRSTGSGNHNWVFNHAYSGSLVNINIDLSPYVGQGGDFILEVDALNTGASRDWACWVNAGISR